MASARLARWHCVLGPLATLADLDVPESPAFQETPRSWAHQDSWSPRLALRLLNVPWSGRSPSLGGLLTCSFQFHTASRRPQPCWA